MADEHVPNFRFDDIGDLAVMNGYGGRLKAMLHKAKLLENNVHLVFECHHATISLERSVA